MQVDIQPGKYVIAVSGGVDSMVLLDIARQLPGVALVVAHVDHGIRPDSHKDRQLVEAAAQRYGLPFVCEEAHLGASASEAQAREVRYAFLQRMVDAHGAHGILTAHHQDDVAETAILNLLRGTGRRGLASLRSGDMLLRPLLHVSKQAVKEYARLHTIAWREDSTNLRDDYLRNYIRHYLMPRLGSAGRTQLLVHIEKAESLNPDIDQLLLKDLQHHVRDKALDKRWFIMLPYNVSCEVMAAWLRSNNIRQFDRKTIERLVIAAKVAWPGRVSDINAAYLLKVDKAALQLIPRALS